MKYRRFLQFHWLILLAILFLSASLANGATFVVTKTADTNDGVCDADCSLREALAAVNANTSGGVIHRIEFSTLFDIPQTIAVATRLRIDYSTRVEIIGRSNHSTTLTTTSGSNDGILEINSDFARVLNLRFANAQNILIDGGAITSDDGGTLIIEKCIFENNHANVGGAVFNDANSSVEIRDSTFRNNTADTGGAVYLNGYNHIISGSTFTSNQAGNGGAVFLDGYGVNTTAEIQNSTFSGNSSSSGSIIVHGYNAGTATFLNITVANNTASSEAIYSDPFITQTNLSNSIVSLNSSGNISSVMQTGPNFIGGNPMLGALAFNGGETETMTLLAGSPAIDAGNSTLTVDQRGAVRPNGAASDLGAFESGVTVSSANTPTGSNVMTTVGSVTLTFSGVSTAGTTTQIPISPSGTPPGGYSFGAGFPTFQISTTASYTPPITICMQVPLSVPLATFNTLDILHFENGAWVPLSPTTRDSMTYVICSTTNSLSPFAVAQNLAPTAANASISGRVLSPNGASLTNAVVSLTDSGGITRSTRTSSFGYYRFDEVAVGQTIVIGVRSKQFQFESRVIAVQEDLADVDFTPSGMEENIKR